MMTKTKQILLIDSDTALFEALTEQSHDYEINQAMTAKKGQEAARADSYDALVISAVLPDGEGRKLCRDLRQRHGMTCPVILLDSAPYQGRVEAGITDIISKPFRLGVLLARLKAHLRQSEQAGDKRLRIGTYDFAPSTKRLIHRKTGQTLPLTEKEVGILHYLYQADPPLVSREELLGKVWGYQASVTTHTLETHIYGLRQKIEEDPSCPRIILTGTGGYQLGERQA